MVSLCPNPHFSGAFAGRFRGSNYVFPGGPTTILTYSPDDPGSTLSDDEQGVSNHFRNAKYF